MNEPVFPQSFIDAMIARMARRIEYQIAYGHLYDEFAFFGRPIRNRGLPSVNTGTRWGQAMNTEQFAANLYSYSWRFGVPTNLCKTQACD